MRIRWLPSPSTPVPFLDQPPLFVPDEVLDQVGSSAHSWRLWHNGPANPFMEDIVAQSIRVESEAEELVALQAIETYRALQQAVKTAPHGKGLVTVEAVVHDKGFDHLRKMYESALTQHPRGAKKGVCSLGCSCGKKVSFRCQTSKHLLTTVGHINIPRRYYACRGCRAKQTPWDAWAGTDIADPGHAARGQSDHDGQLRLVVRPRRGQAQGHLSHERQRRHHRAGLPARGGGGAPVASIGFRRRPRPSQRPRARWSFTATD